MTAKVCVHHGSYHCVFCANPEAPTLEEILREAHHHAFHARDELDGVVLAVGAAERLIRRAYEAGKRDGVNSCPPTTGGNYHDHEPFPGIYPPGPRRRS